jgi:DNA-binding YbaB/EbfC family protein
MPTARLFGLKLQITKLQNYKFFMSGFNLQELMSQAKQQYETLQKKMEQTVVEASSGGGSVTVKMDGRKQVLGIKIDPEAVKSGDIEMLQDLVMAALNEASRKIDQTMQSSVGGMLSGLGGIL